jgi:hypothetical protein
MSRQSAKKAGAQQAEGSGRAVAPRVYCFDWQTCWSSAFRLFWAANMLKHELQQLTFAKKPLFFPHFPPQN